MQLLVKCYDNKTVKSPKNWVIYPQVANQQQKKYAFWVMIICQLTHCCHWFHDFWSYQFKPDLDIIFSPLIKKFMSAEAAHVNTFSFELMSPNNIGMVAQVNTARVNAA